MRRLGVPILEDRIVERALLAVLDPVIDPTLLPWSFAYRRGLGAKDAVAALTTARDAGATWVARADIVDCFDRIPRWEVLSRLRVEIDDERVVHIVGTLLDRPVAGGRTTSGQRGRAGARFAHHASLAEKGEQEAGTRHEVVARLIDDPPLASTDGHGSATIAKPLVRATWQQPDGLTRTGRVEASDGDGLRAGAKVKIWLDNRDNSVVPAPIKTTDAEAAAVLLALVGWLSAVGLLALAQFGVHRILDRRRFRAWEGQWAQVEPDWNNYRRR